MPRLLGNIWSSLRLKRSSISTSCESTLDAHIGNTRAGTHYVFTGGKDKVVKYWDVDRHEQLLELGGHHGEVWCLAVSSHGDFVVSGAHGFL